MPRLRCSSCGQPSQAKMATLYAAWFTPEGDRQAYRLRYCAPCCSKHAGAILERSLSDDSRCSYCGAADVGDLDPAWVTAFFPGVAPQRYDLLLCGPHRTVLIALWMATGDHLPNRTVLASVGRTRDALPPAWAWVQDVLPSDMAP